MFYASAVLIVVIYGTFDQIVEIIYLIVFWHLISFISYYFIKFFIKLIGACQALFS